MQAVRYILSRILVTIHRNCGGPREVIVQHAPEPLILVKTDIFQRLILTGDRPLVHVFMKRVAAVNARDRRLITELIGVRRWPTERLGPIRSKALGVLRMVAVAKCMTHHFVLEHSRVPGVGQFQ